MAETDLELADDNDFLRRDAALRAAIDSWYSASENMWNTQVETMESVLFKLRRMDEQDFRADQRFKNARRS